MKNILFSILVGLYATLYVGLVAQEEDPGEVQDVAEAEVNLVVTLADVEQMLFGNKVLIQRAKFYAELVKKADGNGNVVIDPSQQAVLERRNPGMTVKQRRVQNLANKMRDKIQFSTLGNAYKGTKETLDSLRATLAEKRAALVPLKDRHEEIKPLLKAFRDNPPNLEEDIATRDALIVERNQLISDAAAIEADITATQEAIDQARAEIVSLKTKIKNKRNNEE